MGRHPQTSLSEVAAGRIAAFHSLANQIWLRLVLVSVALQTRYFRFSPSGFHLPGLAVSRPGLHRVPCLQLPGLSSLPYIVEQLPFLQRKGIIPKMRLNIKLKAYFEKKYSFTNTWTVMNTGTEIKMPTTPATLKPTANDKRV